MTPYPVRSWGVLRTQKWGNDWLFHEYGIGPYHRWASCNDCLAAADGDPSCFDSGGRLVSHAVHHQSGKRTEYGRGGGFTAVAAAGLGTVRSDAGRNRNPEGRYRAH